MSWVLNSQRTEKSAIVKVVPGFNKLLGTSIDDSAARLSHVYSVYVLLIFAVVVSTSQFVGNPIHCLIPLLDIKDSSYQKYIENLCWVANTYYVSFNEGEFPVDKIERSAKHITYYQWVPLILVIQMFLFKLPNVIWVLLHAYGGLSLSGLVKSVAEINEIDPKDRENVISNLGSQIDRWLEVQKLYKRNSCINAISAISRYFVCLCNKRNGTFLTGLYLFTKLVYAGSVIGQFFVLNAFMATNYTMYGYEVLNSLLSKRPWRDSPRFPTVTFCDFEIRQLQNVQTFTVQCVLPANLFNEKVFIFMWFWLSLVTLVSVFSLLKWLYISTYKPSNLRYVKKYRTIVGKFPLRTERRLFKRFVHQYLRDDGVFVLRMLARNTTDIVIALLIDNLWQNYVGQQKRQLKNGSWSKNETNQLASD